MKKLNEAAKTYAQMQKPNWKVGKEKDLADFSKGASQSGSLDVKGTVAKVGDKVKRAWEQLKK